MAYEQMTYPFILQRMMNRVKNDYPNLDTREGSVIFNALASAAVELAIKYIEMDNARSESFVATASRQYILQGCVDMGMDVSVFKASAGTHKAHFDVEVSIGSRWNCELYNYKVTEYLGLEENYHAYKLICETEGTSPNNQKGNLIAITDLPNGLTYAKLVECVIEGEDETSNEDIVVAYYEFINSTVTDGNASQYKRWCDEYDGVGNSKVIPLWNGANTVKVSILSASNRAASEELIEEFQKYLDPNVEGMGNGVAPIGAFVTVSTATELPINVSANVTMKSGYTDTTPINTALTEYFATISYEKSIVAYMNLGAVILAVEGVDSISDLKVNGGTSDITLSNEQIPVLGTTTWAVS